MAGLLVLGAMLLFGVFVVGLVGGLLKVAFWLLFLPFRIAFRVLTLPFVVFGILLKVLFGVLLLPVLLVMGVVAILGFGLVAMFGLLLPLLPLVLAGLLVWGLVKLFSHRPAPSRA